MKKLLHYPFCRTSFFALIIASAVLTSCGKVIEVPYNPPNINWSDDYTWVPSQTGYDTLFSDAMKYVKVEPYRHYTYKDSATGNTNTVMVTRSGPDSNSNLYSLQMAKSDGTDSAWFYGSLESIGFDSVLIMNSNKHVVFEYQKDKSKNKIINNVVIEGITYNNVLECTSINQVDTAKITALWTPGFGLIKLTKVFPSETNVMTLLKQW